MDKQMKSSHSQHDSPYLDQGKLHAIQIMLCQRLDELFNALGINLYRTRKMYYGCCPIHLGDNPNCINLYHDGETRPGFWKCNTKFCHKTFKQTIIGFVRGVLSNQRLDWRYHQDNAERERQPKVSWKDTVDYCCQFLGKTIENIEVDYKEIENKKWISNVSSMIRKPNQEKAGLSKTQVRQHLQIPSTYFINRGWTPSVLDKYDIGFYPSKVDKNGNHLPLANRVAIPIYDNDYKNVVGFTARSIFEKCNKCERYHEGECPKKGDNIAWARTCKWYNHNFRKESYLYNYWFAKDFIRNTLTVVLVESPGDVLRLEESGVHNSVAMFGIELSDEQQVMLEMSGALNVVVITNMDEAGEMSREQLKKRLGRSFRLHFPRLETNDIGDMTVEQVKEKLVPFLNQLAERGY